MKTKELIRQLQEEDPTGEEEVCVNNLDIHFVESLPAYYDGKLQVLERDWSSKYYNIIGAKIRSSGTKIKIHTLSITDCIWNDTNFKVDYSDLGKETAELYKQNHDRLRQECIDFETKLEMEYFEKWAKSKVDDISEDPYDIKELAQEFFKNNLSRNDPFPSDLTGLSCGLSYVNSRMAQWDRQIRVRHADDFMSYVIERI